MYWAWEIGNVLTPSSVSDLSILICKIHYQGPSFQSIHWDFSWQVWQLLCHPRIEGSCPYTWWSWTAFSENSMIGSLSPTVWYSDLFLYLSNHSKNQSQVHCQIHIQSIIYHTSLYITLSVLLLSWLYVMRCPKKTIFCQSSSTLCRYWMVSVYK